MLEFHKDKARYFNMQYETAREYILPFISQYMDLSTPKQVLELGCAEAGVLKAFTNIGHQCTGIELSKDRLAFASQFMADELAANKIRFSSTNLYDLNPDTDNNRYDLIILKDVIEHIPNQEQFIPYLMTFLKPGGKVFFGFPPWMMPFGGHQQLCRNKRLSKWAWMHLLPKPIYSKILHKGESDPVVINELLEIYDSRITIERFTKICKSNNYRIIADKSWLFNPIYKWKFGLQPKTVISPFRNIPYVRDFYTTAYYALVSE